MDIEHTAESDTRVLQGASGHHRTRFLAWGALSLLIGMAVASEVAAAPAQLAVDVRSGSDRLRPGATAAYVIEVANSGGTQAGARLAVAIPPGLNNATWTCVAHAGARCAATTFSGSLNQSLDGLAGGSSLEFRLAADVAGTPPAFVNLQAIGSVPNGARCADGQTAPCRAGLSLPAGAGVDLSIASSASFLGAGQTVRYTLVARSDTPQTSSAGSMLRSPVPAGLVNSRWTCHSTSGACGAPEGVGPINQLLGNLGSGETRFEVTAEVGANPPSVIVQSAVLAPPFGGVCANASPAVAATGGACVARSELATSSRFFASRSTDYSLDGNRVANRFVFENRGTATQSSQVSLAMAEGATSLAWSCRGVGMSCPQNRGTGAIHQNVQAWPNSARLVYDVVTRFDASAIQRGRSRMSIVPQAGGRCGTAGTKPPCVAIDPDVPTSNELELALGVDRLGSNPGQSVVYTVEVGNTGATESAPNVVLSVPLPKGISTFPSWTCASDAGTGACPVASGSGPIRQVFSRLGPAAHLTYKIVAEVAFDAAENVVAHASLVAPPDSGAGCRSLSGMNSACEQSVEFSTVPVFALAQGSQRPLPGQTGDLNYSMDVFNLGAGSSQVNIRSALPAELSGAQWNCTGLGMSCPQSNGNGNALSQWVRMPGGAGLRYELSADVSAGASPVVDSILEAVPLVDSRCHPDLVALPGQGTCVDKAEVSAQPLLELSTSAQHVQLLRGTLANLEVDLANRGADAVSSSLHVPVPAGVSRLDWTCLAFAGATCPVAEGSGAIGVGIGMLPAGGNLKFIARAQLAQDAPEQIAWAALVNPPAGGRCVAESCLSTKLLPVLDAPAPHLELALNSAQASVQPGSEGVWTLDVRNLGAETAGNVVVSSGLENEGVSVLDWTCSGNACAAPSGTGPLNQAIDRLATYEPDSTSAPSADGDLRYVLRGRVDPAARPEVSLSAQARADAGSGCGPTGCRVTSTVVEMPTGGTPEITLTLNADTNQATLGSTIQYTLTLASTGIAGAFSVMLDGFAQAGIDSTSWTCVGAGGAGCTTSGVGDIFDFISFMPPGSTVTYSITATVASSAQYPFVDYFAQVQPGGFINAPDGTFDCVPASCSVGLSIPLLLPPAAVRITKTADRTSLDPGGSVRYTVTVANTGVDGSSVAQNLQIGDQIPNGLDSFAWTCTGIGFKAFCGSPSGTGPIADSVGFLNPGESLVYTIDAIVSASASGEISNRAVVVGDNITCTPASCQGISLLPVTGSAAPAVEVSKLANPASGSPVARGQAISWTLVASNQGAPTAAEIVLNDTLPSSVVNITVRPSAGVTCNTLAPAPGGQLTCAIAQGFSGERLVVISAFVSDTASAAISNSVSATGVDQPTCVACSVSNPISLPVDVAVANARAFSAGGVQGTLVDIANLSAADVGPFLVSVNPASALRLFAPLSSGCTATEGAGGSVSVSCPNPPSSQGIQCTGNVCSIAGVPQGGAITVFVALNANSAASLEAPVAGDTNPSNNAINLPAGGSP